MSQVRLEHVNITVSDPKATATRLCEIFDWKVRWQGEAKNHGTTYHVGSDDTYLAVYALGDPKEPAEDSYTTRGGLNHVGLVVNDLAATEKRVRQAGYVPHSHANYEPGQRFYFADSDGIDFEVIAYDDESKAA